MECARDETSLEDFLVSSRPDKARLIVVREVEGKGRENVLAE
jgi:hypothetical protein